MPLGQDPYRTPAGGSKPGLPRANGQSSGASHTRKLIRTDRVRYPGVDERVGDDTQYQEWRDTGRRLRPMRDAGLFVERQNARDLRRTSRVKRRRLLIAVAVIALVIGTAVAWQVTSDRRAAYQTARAATLLARTGAKAPGVAVAEAADPVPTPVYATYKKIKLHLPMSMMDFTEIAFHQASYSYALSMKTHMPKADLGDAKKNKGTKRALETQAAGPEVPLVGSALVLWRDRPGKPDTAADIGAAPGSVVLSPATGTVVLVKKYSLYGKYDDVQLHIQPDGYPNVDVVVIHFTDPSVKAGDKVVGGITPVGKVRKLSDKMNLQLRTYTKGGGDHVHVQVNDAKDPSYEGLKGAIKVEAAVTE